MTGPRNKSGDGCFFPVSPGQAAPAFGGTRDPIKMCRDPEILQLADPGSSPGMSAFLKPTPTPLTAKGRSGKEGKISFMNAFNDLILGRSLEPTTIISRILGTKVTFAPDRFLDCD